MSKGHRPRKVDREKYAANYDRIFGEICPALRIRCGAAPMTDECVDCGLAYQDEQKESENEQQND